MTSGAKFPQGWANHDAEVQPIVPVDPTTGDVVAWSTLGSGGGGGSASDVTIHDPTTTANKLAVNADGSINVNPSSSSSSTALNDATTATQHLAIDASGNASVKLGAALPAGTNVIGHVLIDSAGNVSITSLPSLPAGTAVIGHVIVDSAASVSITALPAIPAGTNVIGHVIVDSGGNLTITSLPALPAGTNVIGHVIVDSAGSVSVTALPALPTGTNSIGTVGLNAGTNVIGHVVVDSGTVSTSAPTDASTTGTITTNGGTVQLTLGAGQSNWTAGIAGTFTASTTLVFEETPDGGTTWYAMPVFKNAYANAVAITSITGSSGACIVRGTTFASSAIRVRATAFAGGDSLTVNIRGSLGSAVALSIGATPAGSSTIGNVTCDLNVGTVITNPLYVRTSMSQGYTTAYASNLAATVANTDYVFKWGAGGTTVVHGIFLQNNTGASLQYDLDVATTAGSPVLAAGAGITIEVQSQALHLLTTAIQNVNGSSAGNICVR